MPGVEGRHGPGGLWEPWHDVAEVGRSQGHCGALRAEDALGGQLKLKWVQVGEFWDLQCRECCCGATGAEAGIGRGVLGCSIQGVPRQGG